MWYLDLMRSLLEKLPESKRQDGELFLKGLFSMTAQVGGQPEMAFYLGLVEKSFLKFESEPKGSVNLSDFSRHVLGLTLLYMKSSEDLAIWNSDFIPHLRAIKQFLDLDKENKSVGRLLNQFEAETFAKLEHKVDIDFIHLRSVFQKHGTLATAKSFIEACKGLKNDGSPGFNQLLQDAQEAVIIDSLFGKEAVWESNLEKLTTGDKLNRLGIFKAITGADESMDIITQVQRKVCL